MFKNFLYKLIKNLAARAGRSFFIYRINKSKDKNRINLNIGAGNYVIEGFKSLDVYTPHYYKSKKKFLEERVEYNMREDLLPYKDNSVDNIYRKLITNY